MNIFATVENGVVHARVTYADDQPAANVPVKIVGPGNVTFVEIDTDVEGRVRYEPTQFGTRHTLIAETPDGHRAQANIEGSLIVPPSGEHVEPTAGELADIDARIAVAVAREIRPLREQLDAFEKATRLRDVLGGIGYIVGVAGAFVLLRSRFKPGA